VALGIEDGMKQPCAVNLHNLVTVPKHGLGRRVARLDERRPAKVCGAISFALGEGHPDICPRSRRLDSCRVAFLRRRGGGRRTGAPSLGIRGSRPRPPG
jgi:hypothetical protein